MKWRDVRERGSLGGMLLTVTLYRFLGRWAAEPVLWAIAAYFFLTDGRLQAFSLAYLRRLHAGGALAQSPGRRDVYRHYLSFAQTSLERFDVWTDRLDDYAFHYHGEEHILRLLDAGRGALLIGAHMGNFDTLRALAKRRGVRVHILTDRRNSQKFSAILKRFCPGMGEGLVEYDSASIATVFELKCAIERGELVGLLADRVAGENARSARRVSPALFLGDPAYFPQAPWIFAQNLECPVLLLFGLRRARRVYDLHVEPFAERIEGTERAMAAYAARLEHYCRRYPLQWFNFYDFWRAQP